MRNTLTVIRMEHKPLEEVQGQRVKEALARAGLSERQAALSTGIALTTLNRKIRGHVPFTATELHKLGGLLGVSGSSLMAEAEEAVA